jgi:hypothetical protein
MCTASNRNKVRDLHVTSQRKQDVTAYFDAVQTAVFELIAQSLGHTDGGVFGRRVISHLRNTHQTGCHHTTTTTIE